MWLSARDDSAASEQHSTQVHSTLTALCQSPHHKHRVGQPQYSPTPLQRRAQPLCFCAIAFRLDRAKKEGFDPLRTAGRAERPASYLRPMSKNQSLRHFDLTRCALWTDCASAKQIAVWADAAPMNHKV